MRVSGSDLRLLQVFDAVVRHGGFAAAAVDLNVSQSTISNHMTALEERLGFVLCQRGRGGFHMTEKGRAVWEAGRQLEKALQDFSTDVASVRGELRGELRIGILDAADQMTAGAVDTLLKTLEEPTEHTLLIIIASSVRDVPPTITSRCHVIDLCPVPSDTISQHLLDVYAVDPDLASRIAETSTGRPGWAIRMAQDPAAWDTHCSGQQEAMAFESSSTAVRFTTAGNLLSRSKLVVQRKESHEWLNALELEQSHTLRNAMQSHTTTATPEDQTRLHAAIGRLLRTTETRRAIAANVSPQLALEDLALRPISESVLPSSESHDRH